MWETEEIERMGGGGRMSEREGGKRMELCGRDGERRGRDAAFLVMAQTRTAGADRRMEGIDGKGRNEEREGGHAGKGGLYLDSLEKEGGL